MAIKSILLAAAVNALAVSGAVPAPASVLRATARQVQASTPQANPVPHTPESISRGKSYFLQNCQSCHDEDGKARSAAVAIAADLTAPERWKFGRGDAEVFATIHNGAAEAMPPFGSDLKNEQIWDIINFIRSIGPETMQPKK